MRKKLLLALLLCCLGAFAKDGFQPLFRKIRWLGSIRGWEGADGMIIGRWKSSA
jgi:hypothetical protein